MDTIQVRMVLIFVWSGAGHHMAKGYLEESYSKYVVEMQLERTGLFEVMQMRFPIQTVLYPGCFVHVTPAYFFPHVVFVDINETAQKSFASQADVLDLVNRRKRYPEPAFVRFIHQDYTTALPLRENSFDLLLALYAGGIALACQRYLKSGGLLLTNDYHQDALQASASPGYRLIAVIFEKRKVYKIEESDLDAYLVPWNQSNAKTYIRRIKDEREYVRKADYYIFQKL